MPTDSAGWKDDLNRRLKDSAQRQGYAAVKALIIYWEESDPGFEEEGRALAQLFQSSFEYDVDIFPIPSSHSYLRLHNFITQSLLAVTSDAESRKGAPLLIIHYGGHGDRNDDRHGGEERQSVWAAHAHGGPSLEWFRIQDDIKATDTDTLLLLDCCFAAQAARSRDTRQRPGGLEILAAAAMGMETLGPGRRSFTVALMKEMQGLLDATGAVAITDLHARLAHRDANLFATPFYVNLRSGARTIRLGRLAPVHGREDIDMVEGSVLQLLIQTKEQLDGSSVGQIAEWLETDMPRTIARLEVLDTSTKIDRFVEGIRQEKHAFPQELTDVGRRDIMEAWNKVATLVKLHCTQSSNAHHRQENGHGMGDDLDSTSAFLRQLNVQNSAFVDTVERTILEASADPDSNVLETAIEDPGVQTLGIVDHLRLRQIVLRETPLSEQEARGSLTYNQVVLVETKQYSQYVDPAQIPDLTSRVRRLAELLKAPKGRQFLSLKCCAWEHQSWDHRYVLHFEVPEVYVDGSSSDHHTLQSIIKQVKGARRPSLDQRLRIALLIAQAVRSWHQVGWVHQGISAMNVIFWSFKGSEEIDYANPFLHGFDFARPDSDPSIGRSTDDIAFNVYRHPTRQGAARKGHRKVHDLYSLGVVLLEIGLWQSAHDLVASRRPEAPAPYVLQKKLQEACLTRLAHYAGTTYQQAVAACLASDFGVDLDDAQGTKLNDSFRRLVIDRIAEGITIR
ncbi:uncharacterized protein BO95DRAFT_512912 [Aspergillus brunneoviolaceus CBS 621.78]|uniref:Uncharacterized protein n=1 Tax=Aspergillus brunneoviolaceus CBS 621.78 TaxID=1450534 RepID=A0ACD1GF65_9EURO|nr:hypothetical protein BO95DRAFT_512912 [Aspergillus brunneoviolaceus CBS 621.78]RAH47764.1 hypothetical protein BO95DRAFT_512912 [Aspergillus brunneoviolaceus CBS 621.78]